MKKFLIAAIGLLLAAVGGYYAVFHAGFYLNFRRDTEISVPFRAAGTQLQRHDGEAYVPLVLRGVDVSASIPGQYATAYAPDEADYLRWFEAIGDMGANAVRAVTVMDDDFYHALYTYNTGRSNPLYLLQGISIPDDAGDGSEDAYGDEFLGSLIDSGKDLVDVIHGRKNLAPGSLQGSGSYRRDISPWTAGILVGAEWYPDTIAYLDHSVVHTGSYTGTYFQTGKEATAFEAMLARVMEEITAYETEKYGQQRPIGFISDPSCDFLRYEEIYARQLQKYAWLDAEHVRPTAAMAAGCFAAYRLYELCQNFSSYLSEAQKAELADILAELDTGELYGGYLELLARHHTMPVIAAGYGFSSSRGAVRLGQAPLTEREQGAHLAQASRTLEADGWCGGFISTWQDVWERRTWNTSFAAAPTQNYLWHDLQTDGQGYGLLAFAPGEEPVCTLDGDPSEWKPEDFLMEHDGLRVSARWDAEGLFLLVEGVNPQERVYLPMDVSPEVGSRISRSPALRFEREADFLLCLTGPGESRLLVQERYDAMRESFLYEVNGENPFTSFPDRSSAGFIPVRMAVENRVLVDALTPETGALRRMGTWETGRLTHGSGDPDSTEYNSLADFCYGDSCAEVRLPWLLLNVGDPAKMAVHRDYYRYYGVELESVREIYLGVVRAADSGETPMQALRLKGWNTYTEYRERLKESYYVMKALWKGGVDDAADR